MLFKFLKKPAAWIWNHSRDRFILAAKELSRRSKIHYKKIAKEWHDSHQTEESTVGEGFHSEAITKEKKRIEQPHKRPVLASKHTRLKLALASRSLPTVIQTASEVLNEFYPQMPVEMSQTHEIISHIPVFFDEAKVVRQRKLDGKIGRTLQHEILAEKWKIYFGDAPVGKILEELPTKTERDKLAREKAEKERAAETAEEKTNRDGKEREKTSSVAQDDAVADAILEAGEVLERWFSWGGIDTSTWDDHLTEDAVVTAVVGITRL
jgi:hypothetical protein